MDNPEEIDMSDLLSSDNLDVYIKANKRAIDNLKYLKKTPLCEKHFNEIINGVIKVLKINTEIYSDIKSQNKN